MQRGGQVSRDHYHARRSVARHPALAWLVRGQGLRPTALRVGRAQAFAPGQQLLRVLRALYPLVVPGRVVAVGHRQLRQPRRTPLDQRRVDLGVVRVQQVERPDIQDDEVRHERSEETTSELQSIMRSSYAV